MANGVDEYHRALVPTSNLVQPTPVYELLFSLVLCWLLLLLAVSAGISLRGWR